MPAPYSAFHGELEMPVMDETLMTAPRSCSAKIVMKWWNMRRKLMTLTFTIFSWSSSEVCWNLPKWCRQAT